MANVVYEDNVHCPRCQLVMSVEYAAETAEASATVRVECPYCGLPCEVVLRRPATVFVARPHGTPGILARH